jgi:hypothetical protein
MYLMSLLNNGALTSHFLVIVLLHYIQLNANIQDPKFCLKRSTRVLAMIKCHVWVKNVERTFPYLSGFMCLITTLGTINVC